MHDNYDSYCQLASQINDFRNILNALYAVCIYCVCIFCRLYIVHIAYHISSHQNAQWITSASTNGLEVPQKMTPNTWLCNKHAKQIQKITPGTALTQP